MTRGPREQERPARDPELDDLEPRGVSRAPRRAVPEPVPSSWLERNWVSVVGVTVGLLVSEQASEEFACCVEIAKEARNTDRQDKCLCILANRLEVSQQDRSPIVIVVRDPIPGRENAPR